MIKTRDAVWLMALAIAAGACKKGKAGGPDPAGGGGGGAPMGMPVEVVVARTDTVRDEITATGQIEAVQSIDLRPEVDGRIVEILIREGQEVDQGTPLFKVDDAQLQAQVAQLAAQRDLAQQALARAKELAQQNASSAADLEQAEATARSAQAQYDLQRIRLDRTTVRAPFAGVVGQRYVSLGDYVTTSTRLASLHTVNPQRATFQVPERFARLLRPGQEGGAACGGAGRAPTGLRRADEGRAGRPTGSGGRTGAARPRRAGAGHGRGPDGPWRARRLRPALAGLPPSPRGSDSPAGRRGRAAPTRRLPLPASRRASAPPRSSRRSGVAGNWPRPG